MSETNTENRPSKRKFNRRRRSQKPSNQKNDQANKTNRDNKTNHKNDRNKKHQFSKNQHRSKNKKNSKWNKFRISEHFVKRDFDSRKKDCSCAGSLRISLGLVGIIEAIRAKVNKRIDILTGYYCPECKERQYGIKRDFHHLGVAADIRVSGMTPVELFLLAETYPEIKGLGLNLDEGYVHIDTRKEDNRESWVEVNQEWVLLTEENREKYIKTNDDEKKPIEKESNLTEADDQSTTDSEV